MDISILRLHDEDMVYPDKPFVSSIWKSLDNAMVEFNGLAGRRVAIVVQRDDQKNGCMTTGLIIAKQDAMTCDDLPPHLACIMVEPGMSAQDIMLRFLIELSEHTMRIAMDVKSGRLMVLPVGEPGERD
ncbi:MAG: hypothetical protein ABFD54_04375 [Armatimonadota bacterium]